MHTHRHLPDRTAQQGFSLIEVVIAIALLTIGILAAGSMQLGALRGNFQAKRLSQAVAGNADRLEQLMALPFDDPLLRRRPGRANNIAALDNTDSAPDLADHSRTIGRNMTAFWNIADDYPLVGCKTIRVIVRRDDLDGAARTTSMDFIRMQPL